jgi:hypothetical protein
VLTVNAVPEYHLGRINCIVSGTSKKVTGVSKRHQSSCVNVRVHMWCYAPQIYSNLCPEHPPPTPTHTSACARMHYARKEHWYFLKLKMGGMSVAWVRLADVVSEQVGDVNSRRLYVALKDES